MNDTLASLIDSEWTLFLDRDGVLNRNIPGGYVCDWEEFEFLQGVLDAMAMLNSRFQRIFVVTNQQGVGKGLMTESDLSHIHDRMYESIRESGGRIDAIYYCPSMTYEDDFRRKPSPGMALQAKTEFPEVLFSRSIMVGDSISDMEFGHRLGMKTVFIQSEGADAPPPELTTAVYPSLFQFAISVFAGSRS
ncbi:MAG: HAD family hydrolase [Saprospirales bacterium]|nr:HAD family hydrolase [Saprospirales bacterium]MBK7336423.1 HAD family hydrolase [Saprospirales bacterium]